MNIALMLKLTTVTFKNLHLVFVVSRYNWNQLAINQESCPEKMINANTKQTTIRKFTVLAA